MRIFVAGATGALGKRLVPMLVDHGHEVTGMTRSRREAVAAMGAEPVVADALDRDAVMEAVVAARPDVVVHELTALAGAFGSPLGIIRAFRATNRLRIEGTDNLVAAAHAAGARRFVAQSFASWPYAREGGPVKSEDDPLDPHPPRLVRAALDAIRHLEDTVTGAPGIDGVVLRYGGFYGPGTSISSNGGEQTEAVRKRRLPLIGDGGGIWSLVHIDDAASATVAAIEGGEPGTYNVVDDDPAPLGDWVPALAEVVGAKPPRRMPRPVARVLGGKTLVVLMTDARGASNAKAKRELGWELEHPTWREGFANAL